MFEIYKIPFTVLGLLFDILGVILVWKFAIPNVTNRDGTFCLAVSHPEYAPEVKRHQELVKRHDIYARIGMIFIVVGFSLQFIGNL